MALLPYHVPGLLFAVLEWGVAVALLALNPRHRGSRAFALLVTLRGMTTSLVMLGGQGVPPVLDDPAQVELARRLFPYAAMSLFPATLYFLAVYLRAPGGARRAGWLAPLALALAGAQEALYLLDHSLWFGAGTAAVPVGPLTALVPLNRAGYVVAAILFLREARRAPAGPRRSAFLAMSAGFGIFPLVGLLAFGAFGVVAGRPPAFLAAYAVAAGLAAGLLARLARSALADADAGLRRAARRYLVALALFAATLLPVAGLPPGTDRETTLTLLSGLWLLPQPLLCAYALLRHQLFDIDLKVKWTIKQSTVAGMFIGVFFIVSEGAQQVF
ncbi:MAG TPA: hypothetical protein VGR28_02360, partial [Candidatus Thermoplasmatota archaeon]|nr:hypothetical protein [Candidatus Thermoplasmatota archaeon]